MWSDPSAANRSKGRVLPAGRDAETPPSRVATTRLGVILQSSNLWEGSLFPVPQMPQVPHRKNAPRVEAASCAPTWSSGGGG